MKFSKMSINQKQINEDRGRPPIPNNQYHATWSSGSSSNIKNMYSSPVIHKQRSININHSISLNSSLEKEQHNMRELFHFE